MRRNISIISLACITLALPAQLPDTELWLFEIKTAKNVQRLEKPVNLTKRAGYDNQPSFSADGKKIFYVSIREDKQADIYCYDLNKKKTLQLTKSPISEYSPRETGGGKLLASVVVETDSSQTIHFINVQNGIHEKKLEADSVGYYAFLNADTVIYYKLTDPHSLRYFIPNTREERWLGDAPVRAFKAINRHTLLYGLKDSTKTVFYTYDFMLRKAQRYTEFPSLNEDFIWHPKLGFIKSEGNTLLRFDDAKKEWLLLFDLSAVSAIKKITRFDIDLKGKYLVVAENL